MTTYTKQVNFPHTEQKHGVAAQARHFLWHLLEMILAMSIGMAVGGALALWAAWMRHRGMEWRPIAEMSGVMFIEAVLLIGVVWLGILSKGGLVLWQHALMIPAMVVLMLFRLDLYSGRAGHMGHPDHDVGEH